VFIQARLQTSDSPVQGIFFPRFRSGSISFSLQMLQRGDRSCARFRTAEKELFS
jgi:hypothetical protein